MYVTEYQTPIIGKLILASEGEGLRDCYFEHDRYFSREVSENGKRDDALAAFAPVREWLDRYFAGEKPSPRELLLMPQGTDFQMRVRQAMIDIPYGQLSTYGRIAASIEESTGKRSSARAVGGAVGHNPLCLIVPCHRVVGSNGSLTGFGGGLETKVKLLEHEGAPMERLAMPKHVPAWNDAIDAKNRM